MKMHKVLASLGMAGTCLRAGAQSFNIDLDVGFGPPEGGNGAPSAAFGAASGQAGVWNRIGAASHSTAWSLVDLGGEITGASLTNTISGAGGGSGWTGNTGDHRLLMNDYKRITIPCTYTFSGLLPGRYTIYTYGVDAVERVLPLRVEVPGAQSPVQLSGQGLMSGNQFALGITHAIHELNLDGSSFSMILSKANETLPAPSVNGLQLVYTPVPEASTVIGVTFGLALITRFRRR